MADLEALRASARSNSDEQSTDFISNTELDKWLNQGVRYIHSRLVSRYGDGFIVKGTSGNGGLFSTVSGTQTYSLPTTFKKLVKVEARPSSSTSDNDWRKINRMNIGNNQGESYYPVREGYLPWFGYFTGNAEIHFEPVPASVMSIRLWFVPKLTAMSLTTDTTGLPAEFDEPVAMYAGLRILAKSGEGIFSENYKLWKDEVEDLINCADFRIQESEQMIITDENYPF